MRSLLVVFSQTGNTRKIAGRIERGLVKSGWECDLWELERLDREACQDYDLIGLGSPVFYYQEPFNVADFLLELPDQAGRPWFLFCTHGNIIGNFFPSTSEKLVARGARVLGCFNSYAGITVPYYPHPSYTTGHPDEIDLAGAEQFGQRMAELAGSPDVGSLPPRPDMTVSSPEWNKKADFLTPEYLSRVMPRLSWDENKCTGCGLCMDNCPVGGIDITADPPRLQDPCIFCHRCVNICPDMAIDADWSKLLAMVPAQYEGYLKELELAAARGDFRWLIDPGKIDLNRPLFRQRRDKTGK